MDGRRVALVTGGSSGFGRHIVLTLAQHSVHAVAAFRGSHGDFETTADAIEATAEASGGQVECLRMDVTDHASVQHGVRTILERLGRIDVLVNCAGYGLLGPMECTTIDQARQLFEVNVLGTMRMAQAVVPIMRRQCQGVILNFGSDVGIHANFFQSAYAASKFAIHGLSQVMRWELQGFGIQVAVIDPGWYATEFADSIVSTFSQGDAAVHYESLTKAWNEGVARVEGPNEDPQEVADLVLRVIEKPERFINPIGWNPIRMAGTHVLETDEYEQTLFDHYGLAAFREPAAGGTNDA